MCLKDDMQKQECICKRRTRKWNILLCRTCLRNVCKTVVVEELKLLEKDLLGAVLVLVPNVLLLVGWVGGGTAYEVRLVGEMDALLDVVDRVPATGAGGIGTKIWRTLIHPLILLLKGDADPFNILAGFQRGTGSCCSQVGWVYNSPRYA